VTDSPMGLEPCIDGVLVHLAADPVPHPDLHGQLAAVEIGGLETVAVRGEYL